MYTDYDTRWFIDEFYTQLENLIYNPSTLDLSMMSKLIQKATIDPFKAERLILESLNQFYLLY